MATIPTIPTESPGNFWTSALWNANVLGGLNYLFAPVRFVAYSSTTQSLSSGTAAIPLTLDTEIVDSDGGHSNTTNPSRYTCQTAGLYVVAGAATFTQNSSGTRTVQILHNGGGVPGAAIQASPSSSNGTGVSSFVVVPLAVGDYVEVAAWQNSGSTLTTSNSALSVSSSMWAFRISS